MYVFGLGRRGWRWDEWMRGLGLSFTNPVGTGGVLDVCLCFGCGGVGGVGDVGGEWVGVFSHLLLNMYFYSRYHNSRLVCLMVSDLD